VQPRSPTNNHRLRVFDLDDTDNEGLIPRVIVGSAGEAYQRLFAMAMEELA
jgi:hypothetical protein